MRIAALAGDGVDGFDVFGAEIVENFAGQSDGLIFAHARLHGAIELVVGGVHHHGGVVEQRDLVFGFDDARGGHQLLAVDYLDAFLLQREEDGRFDDVDAERLLVEAAHFEFDLDFLGDIFGAAHFGRHGAAQHRDAGARTLAEPGAVQLVVLCGGTEVPHDRLVILRRGARTG